MDPITAKLSEAALSGIGGGNLPASIPNYQTEQSQFARILDSHADANQSANAQLLQYVEQISQDSSAPQIKAISGNEIHIDVARATEVQNLSPTSPTSILDILKDVNNSAMNMDQVIERLSSSARITPQEMIRYQILASSHTVTYEAIARFANSAHNGISSVFNMGVS